MNRFASAPSCSAFIHRVALEEVSGHRVLLKSGPGNRGRSACGPTHVARLEFPRADGHLGCFHVLAIINSAAKEIPGATREESGVLGFPSRRGLTPRGLHAHGDLANLALHERLPEILIVPREETHTAAAARGNT